MARLKSFDAPPRAPFARAVLAPWPPIPTRPMGEAATDRDQNGKSPALAIPALDGRLTSCILNLHLGLNLAQSEPADSPAPRQAEVEPDLAGTDKILPALELAPDFPQYEHEPVAELAPPVEAGPVMAPVPPQQAEPLQEPFPEVDARAGKPVLPANPPPVDPLSQVDPRLPFLMAPSFAERPGGKPCFDGGESREPSLVPVETSLDAQRFLMGAPVRGMARATRCFEAAVPRALDSQRYSIGAGDEVPLFPARFLPAARRVDAFYGWHLCAGTINPAARPLESGGTFLAPLKYLAASGRSLLARPDSIPGFPLTKVGIQQPAPRCLAPHRGEAEKSPVPPRPLAARPGQVVPAAGKPAALSVRGHSAALAAAKLVPQGDQPPVTDFPTKDIHGKSSPVRIMVHGWDPLHAALWRSRTSLAPLPAAAAEGRVLTAFPLQPLVKAPPSQKGLAQALLGPALVRVAHRNILWRQKDSPAPPQSANPLAPKVARQLPDPPRPPCTNVVPQAEAAPVDRPYPFVPAGGAVEAWPEALLRLAAALPAYASNGVATAQMGLCVPAVAWPPKRLASPEAPALRFLPVRKGPLRPAASPWPRLGVPPR